MQIILKKTKLSAINQILPNSPAAKISDIVFSLLIIHRWGVYNEIEGGVELSPLSNIKYSR